MVAVERREVDEVLLRVRQAEGHGFQELIVGGAKLLPVEHRHRFVQVRRGARRIDVDGAVERIHGIAHLAFRPKLDAEVVVVGVLTPALGRQRRGGALPGILLILEHRREIARRIVEMTDGLQLLRVRWCGFARGRHGRLAADELSVADHADRGDRRNVAERPIGSMAGHLHRLRQAEEREKRGSDVVDRHRMRAAVRRDVRTVDDEDAGIAVIGKRRAAVGHRPRPVLAPAEAV